MERRVDETSKSTTSTFERRPRAGRVALVWRGDPGAGVPEPGTTRFHLIFSALGLGHRRRAGAVFRRRGGCRPCPPSRHGRRTGLGRPAERRQEEVLYRTRGLGWGTDTDRYLSVGDFDARFPARLASSGPRVLKQNRGNGGQGVLRRSASCTPCGAAFPKSSRSVRS
jgi:hypothetical protein